MSIIRSAFLGARQFDQFLQHLDVPKQTLSTRLKELTALGVLAPRPYQSNPVRLAYRLSPTGLALYPNALASWLWERRWASGPGTMPLPRLLHHSACGASFVPDCVCATCRAPVRLADLEFEILEPSGGDARLNRARRWSHRIEAADEDRVSLAFGLSVDRWALLVIAAVILGQRRFDVLQAALGVGSGVLANRLALLCRSGLLSRTDDPDDRRRVNYALTAPSEDLLPCLLTLSAWGRQMFTAGHDTIAVRHRSCGARFEPLMTCSHCKGELAPRAVTFTW
jgi:DNA-binding HxlR family transcriptional regulator